jgi:hypothetical protein
MRCRMSEMGKLSIVVVCNYTAANLKSDLEAGSDSLFKCSLAFTVFPALRFALLVKRRICYEKIPSLSLLLYKYRYFKIS